ncbi:MAG: PspC domain-containing protein [Myxococcota bacterium]
MKSRRWQGLELPERPRSERLLLGVCAGIASRYDIDVTLVRLSFLLLSLAWGLGIVLYLILWLGSPTQGADRAGSLRGMAGRNVRSVKLEAARSRRRLKSAWMEGGQRSAWPRPLNRRWVGILLVTGGAAIILASLGLLSWLTPVRAIGLGIIALGIATVMSLKQP